MRYEIEYAPDALESLKAIPRHVRAEVMDTIERILTHQPKQESKSRIKRLRGVEHPQYRLRVNRWRVFYDVIDEIALVLVIEILEEGPAHEWYVELSN